MAERTVELASGAVATFVAEGPADGPPVVLLHGGLPGSSGAAGWRYMIPALAQAGFRVLAPDRPGFGRADTRPQHWPVRGFLSWCDFVGDFADALGLDTFSLGGNSQGAQTAVYYAVRNPERVDRLALIACGGFNPTLDIPAGELVPGITVPMWSGTEESMRAMLETIVFRTEALDPGLITMRHESALAQRDSLEAANAWNRRALADDHFGQAHRLIGHFDRLTVPIIYLYGRQDALSPVENAYLQEDRLPNVQFFYPDQCGHQGQTDQPDLFNAAFTEFLRDGSLTRATADAAGISTRRPELPWAVRA